MKFSISGTSSDGLLVRLIVAHALGTIFAYKVYVKFTALGGAVGSASYFKRFG